MKSIEKISKIRSDIKTGTSGLKQFIFEMANIHISDTLEDKVDHIIQFIGAAQERVDIVMLSGTSLYGGRVAGEALRQAVERGCTVSVIVPDDTNHEKLSQWQQDHIMVYTCTANTDPKDFENFAIVDLTRYQYEVPNDAEDKKVGTLTTLYNPKMYDWDEFKIQLLRAFEAATRLSL